MRKIFSNKNRLYLITDTGISGLTHTSISRRALSSGIRVIQLREKNMSRLDIYKEALRVRELTLQHKALFIINDYLDIALSVNADGIHLGQDDMPLREARTIAGSNMIIGVSTHSLKQAERAENEGADYIGFGPVFNTSTKNAGRPKGLKMLEEVINHMNIPVVAIGGITHANVRDLIVAGADAAAIASGILSGSITENTKRYLSALNCK